MAANHANCPQGPGWNGRSDDCPPWCEHHYDSTDAPGPHVRPGVPIDPDYLSHVGEWDPVARTQEYTQDGDIYVSLRFSAIELDFEPASTSIELRFPMGMDIVSLSPDQARCVVDAINLRLLYLE